jgi:hypothetical protein
LITSAVGTLEEAKTSCKAIMTKVVKWSTNTEISLLENQRHRNQFDYFITTKL